MKKEELKDVIKEALTEFLATEAGEQLLGTIVIKAVDQALMREIRFEDGSSEPGRIVEKTESWNILDWLVKYLPHVEAAVRGCQGDAAAARNRAGNTRDLLLEVVAAARNGGLELLSGEKQLKIDHQGGPS